MTLKEMAAERLARQQIARQAFRTPKDLVRFMGAMQAQDYANAKWAVGIRLQNSTAGSVEQALARGEILRTHVLRPTWHLVSSDDIAWLLMLTAPHVRSSLRARQAGLELTPAVLRKCYRIIERLLADEGPLSRPRIGEELERAGIRTRVANRLAHILLCAELDALICSGPPEGSAQTYALFGERVPRKRPPGREEALAELARRYFTSRGPATLQDFGWWSGLPVRDTREAIEAVRPDLVPVVVDSTTYWLPDDDHHGRRDGGMYMLPAYDEFLISYKDRSAMLPRQQVRRAISSNGIFRPTVVRGGTVIGLWNRAKTKRGETLTIVFFGTPDRKILAATIEAAGAVEAFLGRPVDVSWRQRAT